MRRSIPALGVICVLSVSCGKNSAKDIAQALCGSGHAKGKMTLGLNLDFFKDKLSFAESPVTDDAVKSFLNSGLSAAGVSSQTLSVKTVESVPDDTDSEIRFLELGGNFAQGFGIATGLIKKAFSSENLAGDGPFTYIGEDFNVQAAALRYPVVTAQPTASAYTLLANGAPHQDQWAFRQTDYTKAKALYAKLKAKAPALSEPIRVAVLDTGVDLEHPDLKGILEEGYDATGSGSGTQDENGHGTHCAGIIAAQGQTADSPIGVAKMANVKIIPVKVLSKDGAGDFQAIEKGIRWAITHKVDVISLSLGAGLEYSDVKKADNPLYSPVIADALAKNIVVVVAAGNEACALGGECKNTGGIFSQKIKEYTVVPCAYKGTICVGATDADETFANYSNFASHKTSSYRTKADVNAPGTAIYSTWPTQLADSNGYKTISGTSMATPYVAGVAAVLKSLDRDLNQEKVIKYLKAGQAYPSDIKEKSEEGRVDLYATLVQFAHSDDAPSGLGDIPEPFTPEPHPVEAPATPEGNSGDQLISTLWQAICQ